MIFDKKYPNMSNVHLESGTYTYIFRKIGIECGAKRLFLVHTRTLVINLSEKAVMSAKSSNFRFGKHGDLSDVRHRSDLIKILT